ncbi:MAG: ATP-binding protein [Candidatus Acidiferrum sp.]
MSPRDNWRMGPDLLLKVELPSDPSMLCVVRGAMERLTETFGFSASEVRSVTRAVDEALTNIMRHSYGGKLDRRIELSCLRVSKRQRVPSGQGFEVRLVDYGPKIDPAKLRGRKLDEIKPGGLGLHFIRQSMDIVEFKRARGTNVLRLVKYLQSEKREEN